MTRHGIENSCAEWWIHMLPKAALVVGYPVREMRASILNDSSTELTCAAGTGGGHLARLTLPFIRRKSIPEFLMGYFDGLDSMTDRELGITGEHVALLMLEVGYLFPSKIGPWKQASLEWQFKAVDWISADGFRIEIKTERYNSGKIWVQTWEHLHNPLHVPELAK